MNYDRVVIYVNASTNLILPLSGGETSLDFDCSERAKQVSLELYCAARTLTEYKYTAA